MSPRRLPPMNALRAFEAAARCGSISLAAEELFVTPSAVSQQIKKLEEILELGLLLRQHRRVVLTGEGRQLAKALTSALCEIRSALDELGTTNRPGRLDIACTPPFAAKFLAPRIGGFIAQHADIDVRLLPEAAKVDYVAANIDVGIRVSPKDDEEMISSEPVWEYRAPLATQRYLDETGIECPGDLSRATLLDKDFGTHIPDSPSWRTWFGAAGCALEERQRRVDFGIHCDQALDAALAHTGIVLGELVNGSRHILNGSLICPFGPVVPIGLAYRVVRHESIPVSEPVELFTQWLDSELRDAQHGVQSLKLTEKPYVLEPLAEAC